MSATPIRVLFTSAGRRVALIECFRAAAETIGVTIEVHAGDMAPELSSACAVADAAFRAPSCDEPGYAAAVLDYCVTHHINLVIPTIDPELMALASARDEFERVGVTVHVSSSETVAVARDKHETMEVLGAGGVPVPKHASLDALRNDHHELSWPLFIKPSGGSASRGAGILASAADLADSYDEPMLVQELLQGDEYTVNVYVDQTGTMLAAGPHLRIATRGGEVAKGRTTRDPRFSEIARKLVAALPGARGVLCFQVIDDAQLGPRVIEINARFGGGYPLADRAGARFAESLIARTLGLPECASDEWTDGLTMLRYDSAVYVEAE